MKISFSSESALFRVVLAGDICPGGFNGQVQTRNYAGVLAGVRDFILGGDLRLVQWETPAAAVPAPIVKAGPNLNSEKESIEILTSAGFNIAMMANNHTGDQGPDAVLETIGDLQKRGLKTAGAGKDLESARAPIRSADGGPICQTESVADVFVKTGRGTIQVYVQLTPGAGRSR